MAYGHSPFLRVALLCSHDWIRGCTSSDFTNYQNQDMGCPLSQEFQKSYENQLRTYFWQCSNQPLIGKIYRSYSNTHIRSTVQIAKGITTYFRRQHLPLKNLWSSSIGQWKLSRFGSTHSVLLHVFLLVNQWLLNEVQRPLGKWFD